MSSSITRPSWPPPDLGSSGAFVFGLPINPSVNASEAATDDEANWHVLSIWQELLRDDKSDGDRILVRVIMFEITSARLLTLVVEALKNVVK